MGVHGRLAAAAGKKIRVDSSATGATFQTTLRHTRAVDREAESYARKGWEPGKRAGRNRY